MGSQSRRINIGSLIYRVVSIAILVFILTKAQTALTKAKTELDVIEPIWKTGEATSGTASAEGAVTKTRIFFKAQGVLLEYDVNGTSYVCSTRMLKKEFDTLDGEKGERDGKADVLIRYDPADPGKAVTKESVNILKKEKDSYTSVKWICILFIAIDALVIVLSIIIAIGDAMDRRKRKAAEKALREAIKARQEAAEKARKEAAEKAKKEAEKAKKEAEKAQQAKEWDKVLSEALQEAQKKKKSETGLSDDWKKVLNDAEQEAKKQHGVKNNDVPDSDSGGEDGTVYDGTVFDGTVYDGTVFDRTVYDAEPDAEPSSPANDRTVYDGTVFDGTVYDDEPSSPVNNETVYDGTVVDGTVYDDEPSSPVNNETVYDGTVFDGGSDAYPEGYELSSTYVIGSEPIVGGMGKVWKVHHKDWDVDLAMKRPKAEYFRSEKQKEDFIGECEAWINLGIHPNIVACYYVREMEGAPTIFSEWMENGSLKERILDKTLYDGSQAVVSERLLDIAIQFAEGLHYAHQSLLIHRDVKPANLLLTNEWEARVADFGIAQLGKKKAGEGVMTPAYCSPEQAANKKLTRKTDIYSWAVSVLEMYLGYRPWQNGTLVGSACRDYFDMVKIPMPDKMRDLLAKCLENETKNRPRDFASVIKGLKTIYKEVTGKTYPRPSAKVSAESADKLNNRALSYLDLDREKETEDLWLRAALMEPAHTETLFNRCLYGYRSGSMTLHEAQCFLSANWENHFNEAEPGLLLAELSLEGGDHSSAKEVLSYVRNYSSQQEELSDQTRERLERLEKAASQRSGWHCTYQLSRVKNYKEQETLQKERDKQLREMKNLVKQGKWDEACTQLMIAQLSHQYGNVLYQEDWMAFHEELSRKCMPICVFGQWPLFTVPDMHRHDRVSFSDDSKYMLCGQKLFELETGKMINNGDGNHAIQQTLASALSPDGRFYLRTSGDGLTFMKTDAQTGKTLVVCSGHEKKISALAISRDGQCFASGDEGGTLRLWDCNGKLIRSSKISLKGDEALEDIQFGYDYRKMMLRYESYVLLSDQVEGSMDTISFDNYLEVAVDLGYTALGMAAGRKGLRYLDLETNKERVLNDEDAVRRRGQGISTASQVTFMHNQRHLLASGSGILYFFDPNTNKILSSIHMGDNFESIAISRNGKYVAAISDGKAQLWRCIFGLRYFEELADDDIVNQCAHVQCSAHPEQSAEQLLAPLMEELADRGYGVIDSETALDALREAHG